MSTMAGKIEKQFGEKEYGLYAIQALYMLSQAPGSAPFNLDLALGFIEKQRQASYKDEMKPLPQYFVQLYTKLLVAKGQYDKALAYLEEHKGSFGMILDKHRMVTRILIKSGDVKGCIDHLIDVIKTNYQRLVEPKEGEQSEYQSIYDHHELLISLVIDQLTEIQGIQIN